MKKQYYFVFFVTLTSISFSCLDKNKTLRGNSYKTPTETLSIKTKKNSQNITITLPSTASNNKIPVGCPLILTEFATRLQAKGRPQAELRGFIHLEQENEYLDDAIGEIVFMGQHYVYRVGRRNYDGPQTANACGIWAVRRKLRHMHHLGTYGIQEDAWYRDSDEQIRIILAGIQNLPEEEFHLIIKRSGVIYHCAVLRLQIYYGIAPENAEVHAYNFTRRHSHTSIREVLFAYNPNYSLFLSNQNLYSAYCNDLDTHGFAYTDAGAESLDCIALYAR
ncbi:MAG: hypothetical protein LBS38_03715 [Endomicrobium sp.]|jgi:hypothetical protein|nr:hypothetical protein [Endomicrobium sp.]